jgi:hypothetical protein
MSIQIVEIAQPSVIDTVAVAQPSTVALVEIRQGPAGDAGGGTNSITSATTSDGTADLDLLNVDTVTATVTGTLTADHIHGNLAGNVYGHIRAGETLAKGDPVYVSGSHGSGSSLIPIVSKADASNAAKMPAIGIMDADVANNATGHMVIVGTITELDTAGLTVNAELYVAAGGGFTATPPTARAQPVARVERANANNGAVIVKVNGLSASDATASTLVRRDGTGGADFAGTVNLNIGVISDLRFEDYQAAADATFLYNGTSASDHRIALGGVDDSSTGTALFGAATAAAARTTLGIRTFTKPSNESRSSATTGSTYTVDSHLKDIPLAAGKSYKIEFYVPAYVPSTEGGKVRLLLPLSSRVTVPNMNGGVSVTNWGNGSGGSISTSTSGAPAGMRYFTLQAAAGHNQSRAISGAAYTDVLASAGNLSLEWAQNASGVNATILLAGSLITVTEL